MNQYPLVTVIIPTFSRPNNLVRAVKSVLAQTYKNIEIIIVDDNGENTPYQIETENILTDFVTQGKITYLKHKVNKNGSAARNTGIKASKGKFITFLDDDDEYKPLKIEKQVDALVNNQEYAAVYCGFQIIKKGRVLKSVQPSEKGNLQFELLSCNWGFGTGSNPMFKRSVFDTIGFFDESFIRHQDLEFMVRFFRIYLIYAVPDILIDRYLDSRINVVDYIKLLDIKEKYLATFSKDINKYDESQQSIIYRNQYADVACHAMMSKKYREAIVLYKKANSFKLLSFKIIAKAIAYGFLNYKVE